MNRYEIINNSEFFKNSADRYPVPYRCVILHALYYYFQKCFEKGESFAIEKFDQVGEDLRKILMNLNDNGQPDYFKDDDLFEIYIFRFSSDQHSIGALFVDRSLSSNGLRGVYPLVFYPNPMQTENTRVGALYKALDEVLSKCSIWVNDFFLPNARENKKFETFKSEICSKLEKLPEQNQ